MLILSGGIEQGRAFGAGSAVARRGDVVKSFFGALVVLLGGLELQISVAAFRFYIVRNRDRRIIVQLGCLVNDSDVPAVKSLK